MQEIDIAVIKATTSQHHVVPKEKHVRSEYCHVGSCGSTFADTLRLRHLALSLVALKLAVAGGASQRQTAYVVQELLKRLADSADWLVRSVAAGQHPRARLPPHAWLACSLLAPASAPPALPRPCTLPSPPIRRTPCRPRSSRW